jgi:3-dehydrosphinganine reductase
LIKKANDACSVYSISADVSKQAPVQEACEKAVQLMGGLDSVICSAGASLPCLFIATPESEFERLMQINYTGIVYVTKTCVPHLIRAGKGGRIVLVSSMAGLSGVAGFTAYSASKFALRGFAESLHMELSGPYGIAVSVVNPPDVDTPMLHRENEIKPLECRQISEGSGLFTAANIAGDIVDAMKSWKFLVNTGMDGKLLAFIASGTSPAHSGLVGTLELLSLGALRVVSLAYRWSYNRIVSHVHQQRVDGKLKDVGAEVHRKIMSEQAGGSSYGALAGGESKSRSNSLSNGKRK